MGQISEEGNDSDRSCHRARKSVKDFLSDQMFTTKLSIQNKFILFIGCLILLLCTSAVAQEKNLKFEHLGIREGLSHSNVRGILQDHEGFMWFSTHDGLNKYDGYKFTVYKNLPNDENSLSHNNLWRIIEDRRGNIWIATWGGGLNMFDRDDRTFYPLPA